MKRVMASAFAAISILLSPAAAFAHVIIKPTEVITASFQTFSTSVPNEKEVPVTSVRVLIPAGVENVQPTTKPGWNIEIVKNGETVTELIWTGGTVPAGQRDDFTFGAQAPAKEATLAWKAYETYEDGTVVGWAEKPSEGKEDPKPYSETKVVEKLATTEDTNAAVGNSGSNSIALALGTLGILLGAGALLSKRK